VERRGLEAVAHSGREWLPLESLVERACGTTCVETNRETLQRVTRGDLRLPPLVDVTAGAGVLGVTSLRTFGFEPAEADSIDRLERQGLLKPFR
jgi:hypothetical protein